jgi:hypothetical protein
MTATTYYATTAESELTAAQRVLDTHVTSSATGRCLRCQAFGPCHERENAEAMFYRKLRLPLRTPGATLPELVGARCVGAGLLG